MFRNGFRSLSTHRMQIAGLITAFCILLLQIAAFAAENTGNRENLLVNPNWEDGTNGWTTMVDIEEKDDQGQPAQRSVAYQEIALSELQGGQKVSFGGYISVSDEDPDQISIQMSLSFYNSNGTILVMDSREESGSELAWHEINLAIPSEAAYMRASLSILKHSSINVFCFDDLSLTIVQTNPGGTFVRGGGNPPADTVEMPETEANIDVSDSSGPDLAAQIAEAVLKEGKISGDFRNAGFVLGDGSLWTVGQDYLGGGAEQIYSGKSVWVTDQAAAVSLGDNNGAVIKKDGTLWTWGRKNYDLLGFESDEDALTPVQLMNDAVKVSMGCNHAAAINSDGSLWVWGDNADGQLGFDIWIDNKGVRNLSEPTYLMDHVADVSCNIYGYGGFTLVLKEDGTLWTFGDDSCGELGDGVTDLSQQVVYTYSDGGKVYSRPRRSEPKQLMEQVISISTGNNNAAAVQADGSLWAWGANEKGQVGNGGGYNATTDDNIPCQTYPVKILDDAVSVSMGVDHGAALKADGTVWCWGNNRSSQLGIGVSPGSGTGGEEFYTTPQKADIQDVVAITAGDQFTIAVKSDGTIWAWGFISHVLNSPEPVRILEDLPGMSFDNN